ncbi:hypothetical protein ABZ891_31045 [Streptomyces sp. NPDC047023]|uniref:hypothetical protein n=1 Tax=Streptomyces sp. NPDC047023 TaxID=3155139 RepID=UPI0033EF1FC0
MPKRRLAVTAGLERSALAAVPIPGWEPATTAFSATSAGHGERPARPSQPSKPGRAGAEQHGTAGERAMMLVRLALAVATPSAANTRTWPPPLTGCAR